VFRSRRRAIVFPQAEHARLAASIAAAWGNEGFDRPPVPFESFVRGVALHDRGYGLFDTDGIGEVDRERWLAIQWSGFATRGDHPVVDLIVALHVRRLVSGAGSPVAIAALPEMDATLPDLHAAARLGHSAALQADRVTDLCDSIAFSFCFERSATGVVEVSSRAAEPTPVAVEYAVDGEGLVTLDPWPLAVSRLPGLIFGYRAESYPETLEPVVVQYEVSSR
jgi:Protein of unknown function (DUF3891)